MPQITLLHAPDGGSATGQDSGLPSWDLRDLYASPDSPAIDADLAGAEKNGREFAAAYQGKLAGLPGAALAVAMTEFEAIDEILGRVMSYAQLLFSADSTDASAGQFYQRMMERVTDISSLTLFFRLELNRIDDAVLEPKFADPAFAVWQPYLRDLRVYRPHQLSDELERFVHEREVTGRAAWSRLFDETVAGMRVTIEGEQLTVSAALNRLSDHDRRVRETAAHAVGAAFKEREKLFSLITNTLAKDKEIVDTWRRYPRPESERNLSNVVEDEVVDALVSAVTADFPRLSHRYYKLKAGWLGLDKLQTWDRNAPLPGDDDRRISWPEARGTVLGAYRAFDPQMGGIAGEFFEKNWIDAALREGKSGGAFAHPVVPSVHPYILMNYHGRTRDVMTLAHELGHGVHQVLAGKQGHLMSGTPLDVGRNRQRVRRDADLPRAYWTPQKDPETPASDARLQGGGHAEHGGSPDRVLTALNQKLHAARRHSELLPEEIGALWMRRADRKSWARCSNTRRIINVFWAYIPHFIHSPFYVYAYAFGDCLVNALFAEYQSGHAGICKINTVPCWTAGGTQVHRDLLAPFGLDASDPAILAPRPGYYRRLHRRIGGGTAWRIIRKVRITRRAAAPCSANSSRMARTSGAVGGIAARVAGNQRLRHQRPIKCGACRGSESHSGRA